MAKPAAIRWPKRLQAFGRVAILAQIQDLRGGLRTHLHNPPTPSSGVGELSADTRHTLRAVIETLVGDATTDPRSYLAHLEWRARHLPGAADVMENFAAGAQRAANLRYGTPFDDCRLEERAAILPTPPPQGGGRVRQLLELLKRRLRGADEALAYDQVIRPVLDLFAATDAWLAVGYRHHPGAPRPFPASERTPEATT